MDGPDSTPPDGAVAVEALMTTTKVLTAVVAHSLADLEGRVTLPQLRVLVMVSTQGAMNLSAVAEGLGVNASNASRTCDRLVAVGLLDRRTGVADRRHVSLTLSAAGQRLVDRVVRQRRTVLEQVVERMSEDSRRRLAASLEEFNEAAAKASADGELSDGEGHLLRWLA